MNNDFTFERELTAILGEDKVSWIKRFSLEKVFDHLYDYYFEYSLDWEMDIIKAYNVIFNACVNCLKEDLIEGLSKILYGDIKGEQKQ